MKKVMIFEDEMHIQRLIKLILISGGYETSTFSNAELGLKALMEGAKPDLILMDIMMPGIDGLSSLAKIKSFPATADIPVILLTALSQEEVVVRGIKLGAVDYIKKPFHPNDMLGRIQKHLLT